MRKIIAAMKQTSLKNHKITPPSPELPSPLSTSDEVKNRLKTTECIKIIDDHPDNKDPPLIKTRSYKFLLTDNQQQNKGKGKILLKFQRIKDFLYFCPIEVLYKM